MMWGARAHLHLLIVIYTFKSAFSDVSNDMSDIVKKFEHSSENSSFNHLIIDKNSGEIFIGAVNRLYRLDPDLSVLESFATGPKNYPHECNNSTFIIGEVKTLTDNVNKVLLIDYATNNLILCGSACVGICSVRNLNNISVWEDIIDKRVVLDDPVSTAVAFIGPGPYKSPVMYVAVSNTFDPGNHEALPAISSKSLSNGQMFETIESSVEENIIQFANADRYQTEYVYCFSSGLFSYFLTIQKIDREKDTSKLIRVCHDAFLFSSYTEIPLICTGHNGYTYNIIQAAFVGKIDPLLAKKLEINVEDDVLFAIFHRNDAESSNDSSLCMYTLKAIDKIFIETIQRCFDGTEKTVLNHIAGSKECSKNLPTLTINESYCGDENKYIGGSIPLESNSVYVFNDTITAVTSAPVGNQTVAFAGTSHGHIKKILIDESLRGIEYDDIIVQEGSAVQKDLLLDSNLMFLYVMTERRVAKVRLHNCKTYSASCLACMSTKDPFCGWCSSKYKCSLKSECVDSSGNGLNWVSYASPGCPVITNLFPDAIQRGSLVKLNISISNLPLFAQNVKCVFSILNVARIISSIRTGTGIECLSPKFDDIMLFPLGLHNYTTELSIKVENGPDIARTLLTLYDCSSYLSCTECTSMYPCDWCLYEHRCSHISSTQYCTKSSSHTVVKYPLSDSTNGRSNLTSCPSITTFSGKSNQLSIVSGSNTLLEVNVESIDLISQIAKFFHCQFDNGIPITAHLFKNIIRCNSTQMTSETSFKTVNLSVIWNGSNKFDDKYGMSVLVFNCKFMAKSCGECLDTEEKYGCGWCQNTNSCEIKEQCNIDNDNTWLNGSNICPDPEIYSFHPMTGVIGVNTMISIQGINLRQNDSIILVSNETCHPVVNSKFESVQINCTVRRNLTNEGPIIIKFANYMCQSKLNFSFVRPSIELLYPTFGPKSGKTLLRISGHYLNAGNDVQVFINNKQCKIVNISNSGEKLVCLGVSWNGIDMTGNLTMKFGSQVFELRKKFQYVDDPVINFQNLLPRGIISGGINIQVMGENLDSVLNPQIYVNLNDSSYIGDCIILSNTSMICESPPFKVEKELNSDYPSKLEYGFIMDDVEAVKNLSQKFGHFLLYPDPVFDEFNDDIKYLKSEYLTLNGQNLNVACSEADIEVTIEQNVCNITLLARNQLICLLPAEDKMILNKDDIFNVKVKTGHKVSNLGRISYSKHGTENIIISVAVSITVMILLLILFIFVYRKKSTNSKKNLKIIEAQMDKLELRVAAECKEAFAELQTEIFDLTGDLLGKIPFFDYKTYTMNVLFSSLEDRDILLWAMPEFTHNHEGLNMFQQLIMNKTFLLQMINTLESNKYFSMKDRVKTASYLMIILQNEMQYCSDILKSLLAKLIDKCMKGNGHPKLLLRRTDSVAEKMLSSWFSFLLYKYLRQCAGEPLYKLFQSVKSQLDKGPVDFITSEAKYSLGEGKLLRESINFQSMSVYISVSHLIQKTSLLETDTENIHVKVLDCDTISQVKEKCLDTIFKGKSYSMRPNKNDFDLEWNTDFGGRLILRDEDDTNEVEKEWKKLNTLKHFNVPNDSHLTLVSKQDLLDKFSTIKSSNTDTFKRRLRKSENSVTRLWHLVKDNHEDLPKEGQRCTKMVSEIYLTRLLATKGTLQIFVDNLFTTIFNTHNTNAPLPLAIKYMFDFLDDQALQYDIKDPEVVHTWKNNSLPLRFWVNLIKNPNFIFDIQKSNTVDACLSVIAQTFMDSCSTTKHVLSKDSPSSKLLYARDIPVYKRWVEQYYIAIRNMDAISDQDMNAFLEEESQNYIDITHKNYASQELYSYVLKYYDQLRVTLEEDKVSQQQQLASKLNHIHYLMNLDVKI